MGHLTRRAPLALAVTAGLLAAVLTPQAANAATAPPRPVGIDVSYPNCAQVLEPAAFAIVGINEGLGRTDNPCLAAQLAYAASTPGTGHARLDVYVNTQNPSPKEAASWPTGDVTFDGHRMKSPYGKCSGGASRACSWIYGASIARDDVTRLAANGVTGPVGRWWLDVETANSWSTSKTRNRAALEGMAAAFAQLGKPVGLYSLKGELGDLIGSVPRSSRLWKLPFWIAGAADQGAALRACSMAPLTGGRVTLAQWKDDAAHLDRDVACGTFSKSPKPKIFGHYRKGAKLTAKPGTWAPGAVHLAYRWTRDGKPIAKATHAKYTVKRADRGHRIAVVVTATENGYSRVVRTSASHRVAR
ncbi:glycoside hydrolase family 25 domain-containing protein [Amnibacterium setariae]|uniref:DUF1906 domain-containing protein n=1 Tax=Amnibacterium setariae TaxID=2306585 RepID=A0A3A1U1N9_9MICO|nr:hypothetical protein [Amnibacterium setariae]RIX27727.1 hypothetical protein D1781_09260 [Amnibacterium setariae]